jgi:hypothetical protein
MRNSEKRNAEGVMATTFAERASLRWMKSFARAGTSVDSDGWSQAFLTF